MPREPQRSTQPTGRPPMSANHGSASHSQPHPQTTDETATPQDKFKEEFVRGAGEESGKAVIDHGVQEYDESKENVDAKMEEAKAKAQEKMDETRDQVRGFWAKLCCA